MITYNQIKNLPNNHPLVEQFRRELQDFEMYEKRIGDNNPLADEESKAYFDRYIAGDR